MNLLEHKIAIVTGGAQGIGEAIATTFVAQGATTIIVDVASQQHIDEAAVRISQHGGTCTGLHADVTNIAEVEQIVEKIQKDFGRIDILVNNAGITRDTLLMRMDEATWDAVINVNLKSVYVMTKCVQPVMLRQRSGSIINMSSVVGLSGNAGQANYAASKAGIIGFTKSVAKELGSRNIRCNAIAPGFVDTAMTRALPEDVIQQYLKLIPLKRPASTQDIANAALFLASDLSSYITGQVINVSGGLLT